jgi:general secretion pathway protein I
MISPPKIIQPATDRLATQDGATLIEVMIALGILAVFYVGLLQGHSSAIRESTYSKEITVASFLAQTKMEEYEEQLIKDGFPDSDSEEEGDFEDLGFANFEWRLQVNKIELPLAAAFDQLMSSQGAGEEGEGGLGSLMGGGAADNRGLKEQFGGMAGAAGGEAGGLGGAASSMLNPDMIKSNAEMMATMLEEAIREFRLVVYWDGGGPGNELEIVTHLVNIPRSSSAEGANPQPGFPGGQRPGMPGGKRPGMPGGQRPGYPGNPGNKYQRNYK